MKRIGISELKVNFLLKRSGFSPFNCGLRYGMVWGKPTAILSIIGFRSALSLFSLTISVGSLKTHLGGTETMEAFSSDYLSDTSQNIYLKKI